MKNAINFPKDKPAQFPFKAGRGNALMVMYSTSSKGYPEFKLAFSDNGRRKFHRFSRYEAARVKGNEMLDQLIRGEISAVTLTADDKLIYNRALEALKPLGIRLDAAVERFAEAQWVLNGSSLLDAARFYVKRHPASLPKKTVGEAIDDYINAKREAQRSDRHIEDLSHRLGRFKETFKSSQLSAITEGDVQAFLGALKSLPRSKDDDKSSVKLSPRSKNNFRASIISFFKWVKRKKYLSADWDELAAIEVIEDGGSAIEIFTPEELASLLTHADDELIPVIAIGAFAGLRTSEIVRLDWQDVRVEKDSKYIEVTAKKARKTGQRRLVPIQENLLDWIQGHRKSTGKVWPHSQAYIYELLTEVTKKANVPWEQNVLRHSYISYRVASLKNVAEVSLEAGNSPKVIFQNYRELVTPESARRWFSIRPGVERGMICLEKAA